MPGCRDAGEAQPATSRMQGRVRLDRQEPLEIGSLQQAATDV
jgi:hypothetical protein